MADHSAELVAFAARLQAEPEAVQQIFEYCLALLWVEKRWAKLISIEILGREPWCTFKTFKGDEFSVRRPAMTQAEEHRMLKTLREVFQAEGFNLAEKEDKLLRSGLIGEPEEVVPEFFQETAEEAEAAEAAVERLPSSSAVAKMLAEELEAARQAAEMLRSLVAQAETKAKVLQAIMAEVRQVTEDAWAAAGEQRSILVELQTALREYKRLPRNSEPPAPRPSSRERDKRVILALLEGMGWQEAIETFDLSGAQIRQIYIKQFRRLERLKKTLKLSQEDLAVIRSLNLIDLPNKQKLNTQRLKELLEKMWVIDEL
ncbi:MAG: hypothetical protein U0401_35245 [Anaerolineae bacterium]